MDIGAISIFLLIFVGVIFFIAWPFLQRGPQPIQNGPELSALLAERDHVLAALQELDFDHALGKVPPEEYPTQRRTLLLRGADVLRQIDALMPAQPTAGPGLPFLTNENEAGLRTTTPASLLSDEDLEELIAQRRGLHKDKIAGFCAKCGKPLMQSDQFCSCCGEPVGVKP